LLKNPELSTDWQALRSLHGQHQDLSARLEKLLAQWVQVSEGVVKKAGEDVENS
jgi:hypothetical protein